MRSKLAPIILFTYNRPEHTQKVLDALADNKLSKQSELFIFCDGPKNYSAVEKNLQTREIVLLEKEKKRFQNVNIVISEYNKGLANSIIGGVTKIIEDYGKCIVLEDDHITSKGFITYMNHALEFYKNNNKIWSISAFTYPMKVLEAYPYDVYLSYRACSHGWATWDDRWSKVDWDVKDYQQLKRSAHRICKFNRGGNDLYRMLRHQMRGERDSWAIRFCYSQSINDMLTIYPKTTLIKNIGFDGSGTHCQNDDHSSYDEFKKDYKEYELVQIDLNTKITREFKRQYKVSFSEVVDWLIKKIRSILQKR